MNKSLKEVMMKIRKLLAMLTAAAVITTSVPVYNLYAADEQTGEAGIIVSFHSLTVKTCIYTG